MSFTDELLNTLATRRPTESEIVHHTAAFKRDGNLHATCTCGGSIESVGTDESSRTAIATWETNHKEGN